MFNGYETEELVQEQIKALLREKWEHEQVGNKEGVEACERSLAAFGYKAAPPEKRAERRPASSAKAEKRA